VSHKSITPFLTVQQRKDMSVGGGCYSRKRDRVVGRPGRDANYSPTSSAEIKNAWCYTYTSLYVCMMWCLIKDYRQVYLPFLSIRRKTLIWNFFDMLNISYKKYNGRNVSIECKRFCNSSVCSKLISEPIRYGNPQQNASGMYLCPTSEWSFHSSSVLIWFLIYLFI
jgi:hypothetical protein